jgi:hypothetical protein
MPCSILVRLAPLLLHNCPASSRIVLGASPLWGLVDAVTKHDLTDHRALWGRIRMLIGSPTETLIFAIDGVGSP